MKIALGQINPTIGDFEGNRRLVLEATVAAEARGAELALFPELALSGYPPKDLLERPAFVDAARASLDALAAALRPAEDRRAGRIPGARRHQHGARALQQRGADRGGADRPRRAQVASADVRRVRRAPLLRPGPRGGAGQVPRPAAGDLDLRGHLERRRLLAGSALPRQSDRGAGAGGRGDHPQPLGVAVHHREASPPPADAGGHGAALAAAVAVRQPDRRAGRPGVRRGQPGARRCRRGGCARRRARDRSGPRRRGRGRDRRRPGAVRALRRARGAGRARARHARLRAPMRLRTRAAGAVGRDRLGAARLHRGARARAGQRPRRGDALALFVGGLADRRARAGREPGHPVHRHLDRADVRRLPRDAGAGARRLRAAGLAGGRASLRPI